MVQLTGRARIDAPDTRPLDEIVADRLAALADRRWRAAAVMTYGETPGVASDDTANNRLNNALQGLQLPGVSAGTQVGWQLTPTSFVPMGVPELQALALAMLEHVQGCWANQARLSNLIQAAADGQAAYAVDLEAGWPA